MYSHILLPTNGSDRANRAAEAGLELAKALGAKVTCLLVVAPDYLPAMDPSYIPTPSPESQSHEILDPVARRAKELGVACNLIVAQGADASAEIVSLATQRKCDLIVMGTHGRSKVGKLLLGSDAAQVLADCEIPVLLYR
jgi:nucleotide-binding universal stress UspA family protein